MAKINWGKISKQISESAALKDKQRESQSRLYDAQAGHYGRLIDSQLEIQGMGDKNRLEVEGARGQNTLANTDRTAEHQAAAANATDNRKWFADQQANIDKAADHNRLLGTQHWQAGGDSNDSQAIMGTPHGYADISGIQYPQPAQKPTLSFQTLRTGKGNEEKPVTFDSATGTTRLLSMEELQGHPPPQYGAQQLQQPTASRVMQGTPEGRTPVGSKVYEQIDAGKYGPSTRVGDQAQQQTPMAAMVEAAMKNLGPDFSMDTATPQQGQYLNDLMKSNPAVFQALKDQYNR